MRPIIYICFCKSLFLASSLSLVQSLKKVYSITVSFDCQKDAGKICQICPLQGAWEKWFQRQTERLFKFIFHIKGGLLNQPRCVLKGHRTCKKSGRKIYCQLETDITLSSIQTKLEFLKPLPAVSSTIDYNRLGIICII